jgi:hypothetical protein
MKAWTPGICVCFLAAHLLSPSAGYGAQDFPGLRPLLLVEVRFGDKGLEAGTIERVESYLENYQHDGDDSTMEFEVLDSSGKVLYTNFLSDVEEFRWHGVDPSSGERTGGHEMHKKSSERIAIPALDSARELVIYARADKSRGKSRKELLRIRLPSGNPKKTDKK